MPKIAALLILGLTAPLGAQPVELLSRAHPSALSDAASGMFPQTSADGRYVAFISAAANVIAGQTGPPRSNVYLYDRITDTTVLVSHTPGAPTHAGNGQAELSLAISADGNYVAFLSDASDLVASTDTNLRLDVFLYARGSGLVTLVSHQLGAPTVAANGKAEEIAIAADGSWVGFVSDATNLVNGVDNNGPDFGADVFLYERATGLNTLVSHLPAAAGDTGNGPSFRVRLSADGARVAFESQASDLVAGDANGQDDVFVYEHATGTVGLVSHVPGAATPSNGNSWLPSISADGAWVAFVSSAPNLVSGSDSNNADDVFLFEVATGQVRLVSHASGDPGTAANGSSGDPSLSSDGGYVAFDSSATDLIVGSDGNNTADVYLYGRATDSTVLVSHGLAGPTTTANGASLYPAVSSDASRVAFVSGAVDLVAGTDANGADDAFSWERATGTVRLVSHAATSTTSASNGSSGNVVISVDGNFVAYGSYATDLTTWLDADGAFDVFLWSQAADVSSLVSRRHGPPSATAGGGSYPVDTSGNGRYVLLSSTAANLVPGQVDTNHDYDLFLLDRSTGVTSLVSHSLAGTAVAGNQPSGDGWMSADGNWVAFGSGATDLTTEGNPNQFANVFLYERASGAVTLVSRSVGLPTTGNASSYSPRINADGSKVAFSSYATNLVTGSDTNQSLDAFLYDRVAGSTVLLSHTLGSPTTAGSGSGIVDAVSADGAWVVFESSAPDLTSIPDANGSPDVFLYDVSSGTNSLVSHRAAPPNAAASGGSYGSSVSADGSRVAFLSQAFDLVIGNDSNADYDVFEYERATGLVRLVSHVPGSPTTAGNARSQNALVSSDGAFVTFESQATDLSGGLDTNGGQDVFLYDVTTGMNALVSHLPGAPTTPGGSSNAYASPSISGDGGIVAFSTRAPDLVPGGQMNGQVNVLVYERATGELRLASHVPGADTTAGDGSSGGALMSRDGQYVAFGSGATNLVADDYNTFGDAFVYGPTAVPSISVSDASQLEGDAGTSPLAFTVTLSAAYSQVVTVQYTTADGTAVAGSDYLATAGTLSFAPGATSAVLAVTILGDTAAEDNELLFVNLTSPSNAVLGDGQAQGTILNDDLPAVSVADAYVVEGTGGATTCRFDLTLSGPSPDPVGVSYQTADGSATAGSDYTTANGTLTLAALTTLVNVDVPVNPDSNVETDESFSLTLSSPTNATLGDAAATCTILDDDAPSLSQDELIHGSAGGFDLGGGVPGYFRLAQKARSSYEVVLDAVTGDIAPAVLERLAADNTTVLQTALPIAGGTSLSLRWTNEFPLPITNQTLRVESAGCTPGCDANDRYRLRTYDTTYSIARFNNSSTQVTVLILANRADHPVAGTLWFWNSAGSLAANSGFSLPAHGTLAFNSSSLAPGIGGTVTVSNDGRYGDLSGKAVAVEPATGFSFDTPLQARPR